MCAIFVYISGRVRPGVLCGLIINYGSMLIINWINANYNCHPSLNHQSQEYNEVCYGLLINYGLAQIESVIAHLFEYLATDWWSVIQSVLSNCQSVIHIISNTTLVGNSSKVASHGQLVKRCRSVIALPTPLTTTDAIGRQSFLPTYVKSLKRPLPTNGGLPISNHGVVQGK